MKREFCIAVLDELKKLYVHWPKISTHIESNWGSARGHEYLKSLLIKDREYRGGFQIDDFLIIMKLYLLHEKNYGNFDSPLIVTNTNLTVEKKL